MARLPIFGEITANCRVIKGELSRSHPSNMGRGGCGRKWKQMSKIRFHHGFTN